MVEGSGAGKEGRFFTPHEHIAERDRLIADAVSGLVDKGRKKAGKSTKKKDRKPKGRAGDTTG